MGKAVTGLFEEAPEPSVVGAEWPGHLEGGIYKWKDAHRADAGPVKS